MTAVSSPFSARHDRRFLHVLLIRSSDACQHETQLIARAVVFAITTA
jgi:hypothetical protein